MWRERVAVCLFVLAIVLLAVSGRETSGWS